MARRRWGTWVAVILIAAGGLAMPHATQPAGADTLGYASLNGDWNCCQAGGAFAQSWLITNLGGTADTSGTQTAFATIIASQDGDEVTIETKYTNSTYIAIFVGTISCDGNTITGNWTSNSNQVGTFTATRTNYGGPAFVCSPYGRGEAVPLASSISTPGEIFHSPTHDLINGGITIGALLFITFPSSIFNSTFSSHYAEIVEMIAAFKRRLRRRFGAKDAKTNSPVQSSGDSATPGRANFAWFAAVLVIGAILGGLLNPKFGMNGTTVAGFAATIVAFFLGALISGYVARWFRRRHAYPTSTYLHALPLGLAIAAICVLISRTSNFQPGYLYGVVVGIAFTGSLKDEHNAHLIVYSTFSTLAVAIVAWLIWIPVNHWATNGGDLLVAALDDLLGSLFVGGLVGTVIGLLPLELMPGRTLSKWRKDVWAGVMFLALFLLISVELNPASGPTHRGGAPIVTVAVLFVVFGGATIWMRRYFSQREKRSAPATSPIVSVDPPPTSSGGPALETE